MTSVNVRHSRPWQLRLAEYLRDRDSRKIHVVIDSNQHMVRRWSILPEDIRRVATTVYTLDTVEDLAARVSEAPDKGAFLLDMRWTILSPQQMRILWNGIQCLKEGTLYSSRYRFRRVLFDRPAVVVWANEWPDLGRMSEDRFVFHFMRGIDTLEELAWDEAQHMADESRLPVLPIPRALAPPEQLP
jgi:hypothetical protein